MTQEWIDRLEHKVISDRDIYLFEFARRNKVSWAEMEYIGTMKQILGREPTRLKMPNNEIKNLTW